MNDTVASMPDVRSDRREAVGAWAVWALMTTAALWFVAAYAFTTPYGDDWDWIPVVSGHQPVTLSWLWSPHNEHRPLLGRLIYMGLGKASGFDFRAGAFFNVLALSGLSLVMMLTARSLRGRTSVCDAFFPLLLLHWAQCENLIWGFMLVLVTPVVLMGVVLATIVRCGPQLSLPLASLTMLCLVGLGLFGLFGVAYLPAMTCWLAFAGICRWRDGTPHARRDGLLWIGFAAALAAMLAVNLVNFRPSNAHSPALWDSVRTTLQFLSGGLGPGAKESWPVSGLLAVAACGYSLWQLCKVFCCRPEERVRAAGLFCFLGGAFSLALAVGIGRAYEGPKAGFLERYMTLGAPLLCLFYLQFTLYSSPAVKIHLQRTLAILMCVLLLVNVPKGLRYAHDFHRRLAPLEADVRAGLSPTELAARHSEEVRCMPAEALAKRLEMLRQARLGPYREQTYGTTR